MIVWLFKMFKNLFFILDSAILNFIPRIYDLLISISRTSILSQKDIADFSNRIQLLLGIFMLFKVSFSLIMYVVNPDDFSDQSKGIGKLAQNTVISLILLVTVPYIFSMAYRLQVLVLEDNTLARLVLPDSDGSGISYINTAGDDMAFSIMLPFFSPNTSLDLDKTDMSNCVSLYTLDKDGNGKSTIDKECKKAITEAFYGSGDKYEARKDDDEAQTYATNYIEGIQNRSLGLTFRIQAATQTYTPDGGEEQFVIDYPWPFTTIVAAVVVLLLIGFCLDIGLRSVKLAFLQLIAPIPIISYMDPKGGKDGLFGKWYKMCFSTYISLFVRLAALYFGIYLISKVGKLTDIVNGSEQTDFFVQVFIIIGVLMFVKQLPKILDNLGIKLDGDGKFSLNPFKKMGEDVAGFNGIKRGAAGVAGAAMGLGMGAVGAKTGAGKAKWATGMLSGATQGLKGKKLSEIHKGQVDSNKRMREALANGSTFGGRTRARFSSTIGAPGVFGKLDSKDKELEEKIKDNQAVTDSYSNVKKEIAGAMEAGKLGGVYSAELNKRKAAVESAKARKDAIDRSQFDTKAVRESVHWKSDWSAQEYRAAQEQAIDRAYNQALDKASMDITNAENEVGKYKNKDGIESYYNAYRRGELDQRDMDDGIRRAFEKLDAEVAANENVSSEQYSTYEGAKAADNALSDTIMAQEKERIQNREQKAISQSNYDAIHH